MKNNFLIMMIIIAATALSAAQETTPSNLIKVNLSNIGDNIAVEISQKRYIDTLQEERFGKQYVPPVSHKKTVEEYKAAEQKYLTYLDQSKDPKPPEKKGMTSKEIEARQKELKYREKDKIRLEKMKDRQDPKRLRISKEVDPLHYREQAGLTYEGMVEESPPITTPFLAGIKTINKLKAGGAQWTPKLAAEYNQQRKLQKKFVEVIVDDQKSKMGWIERFHANRAESAQKAYFLDVARQAMVNQDLFEQIQNNKRSLTEILAHIPAGPEKRAIETAFLTGIRPPESYFHAFKRHVTASPLSTGVAALALTYVLGKYAEPYIAPYFSEDAKHSGETTLTQEQLRQIEDLSNAQKAEK